ncbi:hypothetical protein LTR36_008420 [Oleoguttula mirabilis]|uniref:WHIM1 domain-containing protein n=1 Tax=Oleoguttula mirabilis TaxID=1507867 RepID=A0AAV9J832_9PEZI|nr:hypothetical protein LTR36_008420 [Oleoguttula mirabilis]
MTDDSDSSSVLSEAPEEEVQKLAPIFTKAKKATKQRFPPPVVSPPRPKRAPSPPHDEVFADNPDIAFLVMFRSRFNETLPPKLAHFGPQDIERGVTDQPPSPQAESLLCALLALVLNRKKPVECVYPVYGWEERSKSILRGHHGRALEEAVLSHKAQWPHSWAGKNPLHGNRDFNTMAPTERLNLLRTLGIWSLTSSEAIATVMKDKYKQQRHNDDENQPLSVQPWGIDGDKRRYFLVQGLDDTNFRVYREGSRYTKNAHWYSVAGEIEELRTLAKKLEDVDGTQAARRLAGRIANAIPTFEASEEKRRKREYRQVRRAAFTRPEPGFSLYEGRTRGKRMRYTYDDDDDDDDEDGASFSDATSGARRSTRHQSARTTPFESGPTFTASGRQINKPRTGGYGESLLSNAPENAADELAPDYQDADGNEEDSEPVRSGRAARSAAKPATNGQSNSRKRKHMDGYNDIDGMSDEEDAAPSGDEWNSDQDEAGDTVMPEADDEQEAASDDEEEEEVEDDEQDDEEPPSLVVKLKLSPDRLLLKCDGPPSTAKKTETNGATAGTAEHSEHHTQASPGAANTETSGQTLPNGFATAAQPAAGQPLDSTPPSAASAYPTPASASFPTADEKRTAVSASAAASASSASAKRPPPQAGRDSAHALPIHQQANGVRTQNDPATNGY